MPDVTDLKDLELILRTRSPLIAVETREESRAVDLFRRAAARAGQALYRWSAVDGLSRLDADAAPQRSLTEPERVLAHIRASRGGGGLYLLLDFHPYLEDPFTVRHLREIAQVEAGASLTLALIGPNMPVPDELRDVTARFTLRLPDLAALRGIIEEEAAAWGRQHQQRLQARAAVVDALARNLMGLTEADARRLARNAIHDDGALTETDLPALAEAKYRLLDGGSVLSFELETAKMADVAGLSRLKAWLEMRRSVFLAESPPPGLDAPKGVLLLGVQGAGKSLAAKACAGAFGVPLLRLDFGTLYNKFYGETERNLREALATAGQMAPCVLWIDEIEKGLATDSEGGPSRRILGTLLTWMAERDSPVFMVATANDVESLPPELLRKGRFDEIFFVDLPAPPVRGEIFRIHLAKRGQETSGFDLEALALASEGFSGAEIEQAVVAALYAAHGSGMPLDTDRLLAEIAGTRPLSVLMAEKIAYLRAWAADRTVSAD
ncbi:MAG: AAA family ATPase [Rhodocyclaceae bacterium]|nr:AAA family ATPase [Rhodocyclaceae bacterium]